MKSILSLSLGLSCFLLLPSCVLLDQIFGPPRVTNKPLPPVRQQTVTDPAENQNPQLDAMQRRLNPDGTLVNPSGGPNQVVDQNPYGNPNSYPGNQGPVVNPGNAGPVTPQVNPPAPKPKPRNYPYATPVPKRPGFVFSPYTNAEIDVRGMASGTLVRDPDDPNEDHKFYVP